MIVTLSDMFTRIKNGQRSKRSEIELHPFTSKGTVKVLDLLYKEGYIRGYKYKFITKSQNSVIVVLLKYDLIGSAVIKKIQLVSHSNKRVYSSVKNLWKLDSGAGVFILATPKGYLTDKDARFLNVGGEILCTLN